MHTFIRWFPWTNSNKLTLWEVFTCHHTDSTIREKIQDSTFCNAAMKVPISCQSSSNCRWPFSCLLPEPPFHFSDWDFPSLFLLNPFDSEILVTGVELCELPNAWQMIDPRYGDTLILIILMEFQVQLLWAEITKALKNLNPTSVECRMGRKVKYSKIAALKIPNIIEQ